MSDVLKEGSPLDKHRGEDPITEFDRRVFQSLAKSMWLPDDFKEYMTQYLALNQPPIPIGQIFGFSGFTVQTAVRVNTNESTTSTSYTDLSTPGPALSNLPPGRYAVFFGALAAGNQSFMAVTENAEAAVDDDAASVALAAGFASIIGYRDVALTETDNSLTTKYRVTAGTGQFDRRWLTAIKYANP